MQNVHRNLLCWLLLSATPALAAGSDENAVKQRAARFYELQIAGNRAEAAKLVEPASRSRFLGGRPTPFTAVRIDRVTLTGPDRADVDVTADLILPLFQQPLSRSFSTPWKKLRGQWYFVVDMSAVEQAMSQSGGALEQRVPPQAPRPLAFTPAVTFGLDGEIRKGLRIENNSSQPTRFRVVSVNEDWLDLLNQSGEIPAGESFPLVLILKQVPREHQTLVISVEGIRPDRQITRLEIPVQLEAPPDTSIRQNMERAIRKYKAGQ